MRYVPTDNLTEGMTLGKPLYGERGELMLEKGKALSENLIKLIGRQKYSGLYIEDDISKGIEIKDVVSDEVRNKMMTSVRRLMTDAQYNKYSNFRKDMHQIQKFLEQIIDEIAKSDSIVNLVDIKQFDLYTYQHSVNVCVLSCILGKVYEMPRQRILKLAWAAILHDIGKVLVDKALLNKPGKFTKEEFDAIKEHTTLGFNLIKRKCRLPHVVPLSVLQHHEKYDGSGYPLGRKEHEITLFAQIISVVDVFDAITSKRPYHEAILPSEAYEFILGNSGQAFRPDVVEKFVKKIAPFPLGVQVQLSNGMKGVVFKNHGENLSRPVVKIFPEAGQEEVYIDLHNDTGAYNVTIQKVYT